MQHASNPWLNNCVPAANVSASSLYNNVDVSIMNCGQYPSQVTPVSTAMYGTTPTFSWAHTVPNFMPWVTEGETPVPDPVKHFTAPFPPDPCTSQTATSWELLHNFGANRCSVQTRLKRKSELEGLESAPQKFCITEERMAARFKEMHITNQYTVPTENTPFGPCGSAVGNSTKTVTKLNQLDFILKGSESDSSSKSLILAPELKQLVEPEKIFASTFLNKVERPTMALMVWQPPNNALIPPNENGENHKTEKTTEISTSVPQQLRAICTQNILSTMQMKDENSQLIFDVEMDS